MCSDGIDKARTYNTKNFGILFGKVLYTDSRDSGGTSSTQEIRRHEGKRCTGLLIIKHKGENRARETFFPVLNVRTIPFHASHIDAAADISGHSHESTVRAVHRHLREFRGLRERYHGTVGVSVFTGHTESAVIQQLQQVFHALGTLGAILDACCNHILFT